MEISRDDSRDVLTSNEKKEIADREFDEAR